MEKGNTDWRGTQAPLKQTVREGTQVPSGRKNSDEEEFQQDEEDFFNILEEKRQYWQDVERIQEHKNRKVG